MAFAVAARYPSVLGRFVLSKRVSLVRGNVSFVASGLNRAVPSAAPQNTQLLALRLKNGYATAAKSTTTKSASTKKSETKTTEKAKRTTAKKSTTARPKKQLTEAELAERKEVEARRALRQRIKELRAAALQPPKELPGRPHLVFYQGRIVKGDNSYSRLSDAEKAKLSEKAAANRKENQIAFEKWVKSHSPLEIKNANLARARLRRLKQPRARAIKDDRQVKPIRTPYAQFMRESHALGELDGLPVTQAGVRLAEMWNSMTEKEKDKYRKMWEADRVRYAEEYRKTYHEEPPKPRKGSPAYYLTQ